MRHIYPNNININFIQHVYKIRIQHIKLQNEKIQQEKCETKMRDKQIPHKKHENLFSFAFSLDMPLVHTTHMYNALIQHTN